MKEEVAAKSTRAHLGRSRCRGEGGDWGYKSPSFWGLSTEKDMMVRGMRACPSRSASYCLGMQGLAHKERGCNGGPAFCMSLNGASLSRWSRLLPRAMLITELLTTIP